MLGSTVTIDPNLVAWYVNNALLGQLANRVFGCCHFLLDVVGQVAVNPVVQCNFFFQVRESSGNCFPCFRGQRLQNFGRVHASHLFKAFCRRLVALQWPQCIVKTACQPVSTLLLDYLSWVGGKGTQQSSSTTTTVHDVEHWLLKRTFSGHACTGSALLHSLIGLSPCQASQRLEGHEFGHEVGDLVFSLQLLQHVAEVAHVLQSLGILRNVGGVADGLGVGVLALQCLGGLLNGLEEHRAHGGGGLHCGHSLVQRRQLHVSLLGLGGLLFSHATANSLAQRGGDVKVEAGCADEVLCGDFGVTRDSSHHDLGVEVA